MDKVIQAEESGQKVLMMLPASDVEAIKTSIREFKDLLLEQSAVGRLNRWLESEKARLILGVSKRTWQQYRDNRSISFSQFGRKIYVNIDDIESFMESHKVSSNE